MGSRQKETVVILAEDPLMGELLINPGSFTQQAGWWAEDNEDVFNTVIIPYYNGWEDNELSDAKEIIDNIPGNVTIGIMGHSGNTMGGYSITDIGNKLDQSFEIEKMKNEVLELDENLMMSMPDDDYSPYQMLLGQKINKGKENIFNRLESYKGYKNSQTISGFIKSLEGHKDGKVKEVMFGSCRMGDREDLSILAEETGILVSGQSNTSWGTDAIAKTGDKPNQRFFVKGKTSLGVQFTPDRDFNLLETVSDTNNEKYRDTKISMENIVTPTSRGIRGDRIGVTYSGYTEAEIEDFKIEYAGKTWEKDIGVDRIDKNISSDIETIRESIDLTQFEKSFYGLETDPSTGEVVGTKNESDYREFLSDLGEIGPVMPSKPEKSLESILMGDFLSEEESPIPFRNKPRADDEPVGAWNLLSPGESAVGGFGEGIQEFSQSFDDISVREDFGGAGDSLQQSLMNLINPEEADLFEADTP